MKGRFQTYFKQLTTLVFNCWMETNSHPTDTGLHDLRVLLKKTRSCQQFLSWVYGKSALQLLSEEIRLIFRQAGRVRELQLINTWLKKEKFDLFESLNCSDQAIAKELSALQILLHEHQSNFSKGIKKADILAEKTNPILCDQYWQELNSGLKKQLKKIKKKDWHEMRKLIKKWIYALNYLEELKLPPKAQVILLNKLEKHIGDWNEYWVISQHLVETESMENLSIAFRKQHALATSRIQELLETAEKKTERQLKKTVESL
jgi:CHAD domain-containing protein